MTKKLIIGCGYLGERVASHWIQNGKEVFALTRSESSAEQLTREGIHPLVGDVTDSKSLGKWPAVDTVLFAVGYDRTATVSKRTVYVDGLANVVKSFVDTPKRFIYVSSTSVYGQSNGEWIDEDSETNPETEGGKICLEAEQVLMSQIPTANVLRLSGIYGPNRLLSRVESLRAKTPLPGDPKAWLNLIHVDDAVRAVLACESSGLSGRCYLVSDNRPIQRREYYSLLASAVNAPPPTFDGSRARHSSGLGKRCRNDRIKNELSFEFQFPTLDEGIPHAVSAVGQSTEFSG